MADRLYSEREKIEAALRFVEPDDRDTWVQVAIAIKSELGDSGFEVWDRWSSSSESYKPASAKSVWKSANPKGITIGTLYGLAKRDGFNPAEYQTQLPDPVLQEQRQRDAQIRAKERAEEERQKQARAADKARAVIGEAAAIAADHPYLQRKRVERTDNLYELPAARLAELIGYVPKSDDVPLSGRILIAPVGDASGISSLEFIDETGRKSALAGGRKSGAWWLATPEVDKPDAIIVGEGIATNASIAEAGLPGAPKILVAAALSDTNLPNVTSALRAQYPQTVLMIASDLGNGEKKAIEAANIANGWVALPEFDAKDRLGGEQPTDFNDLAQLKGLSAVRDSLGNPRRLDAFDQKLVQWWRHELGNEEILSLGAPSPVLAKFDIDPAAGLQISQSVLRKALEKHEIALPQLVGMAPAIQAPIAVFASKQGPDHRVLLTEIRHSAGNLIVAVALNRQRDQYLVNDIRSVHPKDSERLRHWVEDGLLIGLEKTKGRMWLDASGSNSRGEQTIEATLSKVILYDASENASQIQTQAPGPVSPMPQNPMAGVPDSKSAKADKEARDYRAELTERIIARMEQGTAPWQKPWVGRAPVRPFNATTGLAYRGINTGWLDMQGYADPRWATYRQAQAEGWQVRKGEKGTPIEYWKRYETRAALDALGNPVLDDNGKPKKVTVQLERPIGPIYSTLFNLSQMDNVPAYNPPDKQFEWDPIVKAEGILKASGAKILHDQQDGAFYAAGRDQIHLPPQEQFPVPMAYYGTALHELGHWTGHESRLNRDLTGSFGSASYAREELRAELSSYFMSAELGVPHDVSRHASYVDSWVAALKSDKNEIFRASKDAEKIVEYVMALDPTIDKTVEAPVVPGDVSPKAIQDKPKAGDPLFDIKALPSDLADEIRRQYGEGVRMASPRVDAGPYKGEIYRQDAHLIQEVGARSIVVHSMNAVKYTEPALGHLVRENAINGTQVSISYQKETAVISPYDRQIEQLAMSVASLKKSAVDMGMGPNIAKTLDELKEQSVRRIYDSRQQHGRPLEQYIKEVRGGNKSDEVKQGVPMRSRAPKR